MWQQLARTWLSWAASRATAVAVLGAIALFASDAQAVFPCATGYKLYPNGTCYRTGSVKCEIGIDNSIGNVTKNPKRIDCSIDPDPLVTTHSGVVFCRNSAGNQPPGQVLVVFPPGTGFSTLTNFTNIDSPSDFDNADSSVTIEANLADLQSLIGFCPNTGYTVTSFVPCDFESTIKQTDSTGKISSIKNGCFLNSCSSLTWDKTLNQVESREYSCYR